MQYLVTLLTLCPRCPARSSTRLREQLQQRRSFHLSVQPEAAAGTCRTLALRADLYALYDEVVVWLFASV